MIMPLLSLVTAFAMGNSDVRKVSSTSCKAISVKLAIGMTTQIILEQEPKVTLYADKKHFKIDTNPMSPRSLAIIPFVDSNELEFLRDSHKSLLSMSQLATELDRNFKTNLFVFFENNNQLLFELHFTDKAKADSILKVTQIFSEDCSL